MLKNIIIVLILFLSINIFGQNTFYIDPSATVNGNGTMNNPYSGWNHVSIASGNTYLQKRGTRFYGGLTIENIHATSADKVVIGAYGSGEKPQITSRLVLPDTWSGPDSNGVYYISVSRYAQFFWAGYETVTWGENIVEDGDFNPSNTSSLSIGKWAKYNEQGQHRIYYRPGSSDPIPGISGTLFEWASELSAMTVKNSTNIEIHNLNLTHATFHGLHVLNNCQYVYVYNLLTDYNGVYGTAGSYGIKGIGNGIQLDGQHIWVRDTESSHNEDHGLTVEKINGLPKPSDCNFISCISHHNGDIGGTVRGGPDGLSDGKFIDCEFYENGWDNDYGNSGVRTFYANADIIRCKIHDNEGAGIALFTNENVGERVINIHYNLIYNNNLGNGAGQNGDHNRTGILIRGSDMSHIRIVNNTITGFNFNGEIHHQDYGIYVPWNEHVGELTLTNNIIYNHNDNDIKINSNPDNNIDLLINRNIYSANNSIQLNHVSYNLSDWNELTFVGDDMTTNNPLLDENNDFILLENSLAIDAGDNSAWNGVPNISDLLNNDITNNSGEIVCTNGQVDIGASENQSVGVVSENEIDNISIFPNPAQTTINIRTPYKNFSIELINNLGQKITPRIYSNGNSSIDISQLKQGIYVLNINLPNDEKKYIKFLKK